MDLPQSIRVVVPARHQKLRVCPMIAQSSPVSAMEYGMCEVKIATLCLFLLLRRTVSPHTVFISPPLCVLHQGGLPLRAAITLPQASCLSAPLLHVASNVI